jgi:hypothetical protein
MHHGTKAAILMVLIEFLTPAAKTGISREVQGFCGAGAFVSVKVDD